MPEGITPEELLERLQALPDPAAGEAAKTEAAQEKSVRGSTTLTPASLMVDGGYTHATCGMHAKLLATLRAAVKEPAELRRLCTQLASDATSRLDGATRVDIVVAPPLGPPTCVSSDGAPGLVVIWLMLDPLDIDSKQTTFIHADGKTPWMNMLYKWSGTPTAPPHTELPSKIEEE